MLQPVKHFTENTAGKDYVVGDIHGCFSKLREALTEIPFDETKDRLFCVGDLVDRGPESEEALDWLAYPWFHSVRGNHEQMAIDYHSFGGNEYYRYNGGGWMIDMPKSHGNLFAEIFAELPIAIDIQVSSGDGDKLYGIIHAECPTKSWRDLQGALTDHNAEGYENVAMWSRDKINYANKDFVEDVELVYVGHTPLKEVETLGNVIYIDTGAVFGGKFTILEIY